MRIVLRIPAYWKSLTLVPITLLLASACQPESKAVSLSQPTLSILPASTTPAPTPTFTTQINNTPPPEKTPTKALEKTLWIAPYLPKEFQELNLADSMKRVEQRSEALFRIELGDKNPIGTWVLVAAVPFPTLVDSITSQELRRAWAGDLLASFSNKPILLSQNTLDLLTSWWGSPSPEAVQVLPSSEIEAFAWDNRPTWAILPFEELSPRWKVLEVDGQSPLRKNFDANTYALSLPVSITASETFALKEIALDDLWLTNRTPDRLTTLILTGVTALVRGTALTIESKGVTYPGEEIAPWLREADYAHVNNEVPFFDQCPFPELYPSELRFCSSPKYIGVLEDIGADIIELTGDHFGDYGTEAFLQTLSMYQERGWLYYGGGKNADEGRKPILLEHHNNRLAILGCNSKEVTYYAQASDTTPGAVACDFDYLTAEIQRLRQEGYLVVVTFQDAEYYSFTAQPRLIEHFHRAAQAGAVIVSGSQAHQPHGMEFFGDSFIHYGLGNLFFDQYRYLPGGELDRAFIDRHIFYDGRYIGSELLTIQFVDLARPRPTTLEERQAFLKLIFTASGW